MKTFYALAAEENGSYSLFDSYLTEKENRFQTVQEAKEVRSRQDCPEGIRIVHVRVLND